MALLVMLTFSKLQCSIVQEDLTWAGRVDQ